MVINNDKIMEELTNFWEAYLTEEDVDRLNRIIYEALLSME